MTGSTKRRIHSAQFKAKVAMEALRGAQTLSEIGQRYEVHPVVVSQWKKEVAEHAATLFEGKRGPKKAGAGEERLYE